MRESTLRDFLSGRNDGMNITTYERLAAAIDSPVSQLLPEAAQSRNVAQVVGYVGAGEKVYPVDDHAIGNGLEEVDCPDSLAGKPVVAVRVRGDSMLPMMHDGWLLFYSRDHDGVPEDCVGRVCVVKVAGDGPMYVKQVRRGYTPGHYNLVSTNAQQIEDVALAWAARVLMILPS